MNNKHFTQMANNIPKFRVKINPRIAVQRGAMIGWVSALTVGAAAGFVFGYFKVFYPYTFRMNKKAMAWKGEPDFLTNSVVFKKKETRNYINGML